MTCMTCGNGWGSVTMLHDCVELRTDLRPLRLTITYHALRQQQSHGIGKRLIDAQADSDFASAVDDLAARSR